MSVAAWLICHLIEFGGCLQNTWVDFFQLKEGTLVESYCLFRSCRWLNWIYLSFTLKVRIRVKFQQLSVMFMASLTKGEKHTQKKYGASWAQLPLVPKFKQSRFDCSVCKLLWLNSWLPLNHMDIRLDELDDWSTVKRGCKSPNLMVP